MNLDIRASPECSNIPDNISPEEHVIGNFCYAG
jgi:hypothetical protein